MTLGEINLELRVSETLAPAVLRAFAGVPCTTPRLIRSKFLAALSGSGAVSRCCGLIGASGRRPLGKGASLIQAVPGTPSSRTESWAFFAGASHRFGGLRAVGLRLEEKTFLKKG